MWSLPTAVVPLSAFEQKLQPFAKAIKNTRDVSQFPRWIAATVVKCYQWADEVKTLASALDSIQLTTAASHVTILGVAFVDENPQQLINSPHETLLRAILSTPLLPMSTAGASVLKASYHESCQRLGPIQIRAIFISEQERITREKRDAGMCLMQFSEMIAQQTGDDGDDREDRPGSVGRVTIDEIYLASQLILACCKRTTSDGDLDNEVVRKIQRAIALDESKGTLRMLCIGLSLSPAAIYCCEDSSGNEAGSISTDQITIDVVGRVLRHPSLWRILYECAQTDITQFQCLDDIFYVFQTLCENNSTLRLTAQQAMTPHNIPNPAPLQQGAM